MPQGLFSFISVCLGFRVGGCSFLFVFILVLALFLPLVRWMDPRRETGTSRAHGKHPAEPSQPEQTVARQKARYDMALFSLIKDYRRYKQKFAQRKVVPGRNINFSQLKHFGFGDSSVGWDGCQS